MVKFKSYVKKSWMSQGTPKKLADVYAKNKPTLNDHILNRRKDLFNYLESNLVIPEQQSILNYAKSNYDNLIIFENGGTFGFVNDNFLGVLFSDYVAQHLRENGQNAVCITVIDPTDISSVERTMNYAGTKLKIPLVEKKVSDTTSTLSLAPPTESQVKDLFSRVKQHVKDSTAGLKLPRKELDQYIQKVRTLENDFLSLSKDSSSFREFTEGVLYRLLPPLTRNSIFVTLQQWQKTWDLPSLITNENFYKAMDTTYLQANEAFGTNFKGYKFEGKDDLYVLPFRIDDGTNFHKPQRFKGSFLLPVANVDSKEVYYLDLSTKKKYKDIVDLNDLPPETTFLMQDGLLYALDRYMYGAINLAPREDRVFSGFLLGAVFDNLYGGKTEFTEIPPDYSIEDILNNPFPPLVEEFWIDYMTIRKQYHKNRPSNLSSGPLALEIDGLGIEFIEEALDNLPIDGTVTHDQHLPVESPIFTKFKNRWE